MPGAGKELRTILEFLRKDYPEAFIIGQIMKTLKMDERKIVRLIAYAVDNNWVTITDKHQDVKVGPYRITSHGIDKLNSWTEKDDNLII